MSDSVQHDTPKTTCRNCQREIQPADIRPRYVPCNLDTAYPSHDDPYGGCVHCTPDEAAP